MSEIYLDMMRAYIKKMHRVFVIILLANILVEAGMCIRALMYFNLARLKHQMYLGSYLFLLITSMEALLVLLWWKRRGQPESMLKCVVGHVYFYAGCLLLWAAFVSCVDCVAKGDSGVMVYVMMGMAVGALARLRPGWFITVLGLGGVMLLAGARYGLGMPFSGGFYVNFLIFLAISAFICLQNYRLSIREIQAARKLTQLSVTDQLTGVYNRRQLDEHVAKRSADKAAYLFILMDVDDFKAINDTKGHAVGDVCLSLVAQALKKRFGENTYRFGGDEFAVITELPSERATALLDDLNAELDTACPGVPLHISAGLCHADMSTAPNEVFIHADRMLYQAKHSGKARWMLE